MFLYSNPKTLLLGNCPKDMVRLMDIVILFIIVENFNLSDTNIQQYVE